MRHRVGATERQKLVVKANIAVTYGRLGRDEEASRIERDVYLGHLKLSGREDRDTFMAANNYAWGLFAIQRFEETKTLMRKTVPLARRVLGEGHEYTLNMRWVYGRALSADTGATLKDHREAVETFEATHRIARRVLGTAHPSTASIEGDLRIARAALRARETPSPGRA